MQGVKLSQLPLNVHLLARVYLRELDDVVVMRSLSH